MLLVDEAHGLVGGGDGAKASSAARPVVGVLSAAAEARRGSLSIILAGFKDEIEEKLYACDVGLRSRFRAVHFDDYGEVPTTSID